MRGIFPRPDHTAGIVTLLPSFGEPDIGKGAERQAFLGTKESVFEVPEFRTVRPDLDLQASAVELAIGALGGLESRYLCDFE